jgi:hypothetical protein
MTALKITLGSAVIAAVFLVPHVLASVYAEPKPAPAIADCTKPVAS